MFYDRWIDQCQLQKLLESSVKRTDSIQDEACKFGRWITCKSVIYKFSCRDELAYVTGVYVMFAK